MAPAQKCVAGGVRGRIGVSAITHLGDFGLEPFDARLKFSKFSTAARTIQVHLRRDPCGDHSRYHARDTD